MGDGTSAALFPNVEASKRTDQVLRERPPRRPARLDGTSRKELAVKAREMMNAYFVAVKPTDSVRLAACAMRDEQVGVVCVCDEEHRPLGVVTDRDLATRVCAEARPVNHTEVQEIMSPEPVTCGLDATAADVEAIMQDKELARVLVVDEAGQLAGIVTLAEIWHYESPLTAGPVSRRVTERQLRMRGGGPRQRRRFGHAT